MRERERDKNDSQSKSKKFSKIEMESLNNFETTLVVDVAKKMEIDHVKAHMQRCSQFMMQRLPSKNLIYNLD